MIRNDAWVGGDDKAIYRPSHFMFHKRIQYEIKNKNDSASENILSSLTCLEVQWLLPKENWKRIYIYFSPPPFLAIFCETECVFWEDSSHVIEFRFLECRCFYCSCDVHRVLPCISRSIRYRFKYSLSQTSHPSNLTELEVLTRDLWGWWLSTLHLESANHHSAHLSSWSLLHY